MLFLLLARRGGKNTYSISVISRIRWRLNASTLIGEMYLLNTVVLSIVLCERRSEGL
jgi:hypothetical protein